MNCGVGMFSDFQLGNVYAADEDDWDVADKTYTFASDDHKQRFR
jgi:hypothetical protein